MASTRSSQVHISLGMSGASHLGSQWPRTPWSAYSLIRFGWVRVTVSSSYSPNSTAMHFEFVANGDEASTDNVTGEYATFAPYVADDVWVVKTLES